MIEGIGKVYLGTKEIVKAYLGNKVVYNSAPALDPDAEAFLLAAGITDATITSAINNLVLSLKADSIWTKMTALYPFVGGTASTHKFNLKNPADSDAAFRLTFVGSPTHDSNGVQGNGSSQYANTSLNCRNILTRTNSGVSYYSRINTTSGGHNGALNTSIINDRFYFTERFTGDNTFGILGAESNFITYPNSDSRGFFTWKRGATDLQEALKDGVLQATNTVNDTATLPNINFGILATLTEASTAIAYLNRNYSSFYIHEYLTNTEAINLRNIDLAFQTVLTRNV
jgi:hypothetical protein